MFGRWTVPAFEGTLADLGADMASGEQTPLGDKPARRRPVESAVGKVVHDLPGIEGYGAVLRQPTDTAAGKSVSAEFKGAHPNNDLHHSSTYLEVQRRDGDRWVTIADDADYSTSFRWKRHLAAQSKVTLSWTPPAGTTGEYRFVYHGDAKDGSGRITPFTGESAPFHVTG